MSIEAITSAFESYDGQVKLYGWADELFRKAQQQTDQDTKFRFDQAYAAWSSSRTAKRGLAKIQARETYYRMLSDNVIKYAIPACWGTDDEPHGMRSPLAVASVLGVEEGLSEAEALESLCNADIPAPPYEQADTEERQDFDPLDPSTWSAGVATAILRPSGDVQSWAWGWQRIYLLLLANRLEQ